MNRIVILLLAVLPAFAAEDSWAKVRELKSGAELRIYKVNVLKPVVAKFDRAGDESLVIVTKNGQESIPKEEIERIESRVDRLHKALQNTRAERKIATKGAEFKGNSIPGTTTSVTTDFELPSKTGFDKIYDRAWASK